MQWIGYLLWGAYYGVAAIFVWRCTHSTSHKWIALPFMYVMRAASTPLDEYADAYLLHPNVCGVLLEHTAFSCRKWTGILATNPVEYVASRVQDAVVSDVKSVSFWVTLLSLTPLVGIGYYVAPKIRKWGNSRALRASLQKGANDDRWRRADARARAKGFLSSVI